MINQLLVILTYVHRAQLTKNAREKICCRTILIKLLVQMENTILMMICENHYILYNLTPSGPHKELIKGVPHRATSQECQWVFSKHLFLQLRGFFGYKCSITLPPDNYIPTYFKKISGKIVENSIVELDGISLESFL